MQRVHDDHDGRGVGPTIDLGTPTVSVAADCSAVLGDMPFVAGRVVDANNYYAAFVGFNANSAQIIQCIAGSWSFQTSYPWASGQRIELGFLGWWWVNHRNAEGRRGNAGDLRRLHVRPSRRHEGCLGSLNGGGTWTTFSHLPPASPSVQPWWRWPLLRRPPLYGIVYGKRETEADAWPGVLRSIAFGGSGVALTGPTATTTVSSPAGTVSASSSVSLRGAVANTAVASPRNGIGRNVDIPHRGYRNGLRCLPRDRDTQWRGITLRSNLNGHPVCPRGQCL